MIIEKILIDGQGWKHCLDGEINVITKNGEMALIEWYEQKLPTGEIRQYNGKYVVEIDYLPE